MQWRTFFLFMWSPNIKVINIAKLGLISGLDLDILSMSAISYMVYHGLFSVNVSIWLLSTSTGLLDCGALSREKSPAWNFANHFWHVHQSQHLLRTLLNLFFCISVSFLPFLKYQSIIYHFFLLFVHVKY